jgi:hypothetical protein
MSISIRNRSRKELSVGMRMCLDTYLGEENLAHFSSDRHQEIRNELEVSSEDMIRYWLSPSPDTPPAAGLQCVTSGADVTPPDKIVFANWKRLSEASWDYQASSNRNFNLMPYSINDSAVCMYYEPVDLPPEGSREIVLVLANLTLSDYGKIASAGTPAQQPVEEPVEQPPVQPAEPPTGDDLQALRDRLDLESTSLADDLAFLNELIDQIDAHLSSGEDISDVQILLMQEILSVIKDKAERYSGGR